MYNFPTVYWGEDASTRVQFQINPDIQNRQASSCMVIALTDDGHIALSRPARGWGILGGHIEENETPEECIVREAMEEGGVSIANLEIIGGWHTDKAFVSIHNTRYPDAGLMLLYVAEITEVHPYEPQLEIAERTLIPLEQLPDYHHDFENFAEIYRYITDVLEARRAI